MSSDSNGNAPVAPPAIEIRDLEKRYRLGEHVSLTKTIKRLSRDGVPTERFSALDSINLTIERGECLGLVGRNGSGKSTLLHIVAGITTPTSGVARVRGRVLPLFQIGAGFHPDLTGRENVLLFGAVLGISRRQIEEQMGAIAAFAEIESHLDTPNKRYSDGMQARLSCALAVLFPADIYLFDEVLAVVDGSFRDRCLEQISRLVREGRTVVLVGHDLDLHEAVTDRIAWIEGGKLRAVGPRADLLGEYRSTLGEH